MVDSNNNATGIIIDNTSIVGVTVATSGRKELYLWYYKMSIFNSNKYIIQIVNCQWTIDNFGTTIIVKDADIIKKRPTVHPLEVYEHGSYVTLEVAGGIVYGNYEFINTETQEIIKMSVSPFLLGKEKDNKRFH